MEDKKSKDFWVEVWYILPLLAILYYPFTGRYLLTARGISFTFGITLLAIHLRRKKKGYESKGIMWADIAIFTTVAFIIVSLYAYSYSNVASYLGVQAICFDEDENIETYSCKFDGYSVRHSFNMTKAGFTKCEYVLCAFEEAR